jgi:hypothetical protein
MNLSQRIGPLHITQISPSLSDSLSQDTRLTLTTKTPPPVQVLSTEDFESLLRDCRVVEKDEHGEKVLILSDGTYLKIFRRKRLFSSYVLKPYSKRFIENCQKLAVRGIPSPTILQNFQIPGIKRDAVRYRPLEGKTVFEKLSANDFKSDDSERLVAFIKSLHEKKIYFRSLHLGNIVQLPSNDFGLIDVADLKFLYFPLGKWRRKRNMRHITRRSEHRGFAKSLIMKLRKK